MNEGSLRFSYLVIATSALAHLTSELVALRASGGPSSFYMADCLSLGKVLLVLKEYIYFKPEIDLCCFCSNKMTKLALAETE